MAFMRTRFVKLNIKNMNYFNAIIIFIKHNILQLVCLLFICIAIFFMVASMILTVTLFDDDCITYYDDILMYIVILLSIVILFLLKIFWKQELVLIVIALVSIVISFLVINLNATPYFKISDNFFIGKESEDVKMKNFYEFRFDFDKIVEEKKYLNNNEKISLCNAKKYGYRSLLKKIHVNYVKRRSNNSIEFVISPSNLYFGVGSEGYLYIPDSLSTEEIKNDYKYLKQLDDHWFFFME